MVRGVLRTITILFFFNILIVDNAFAKNSVLSSGVWYKLSLTETGMYSISYQDLKAMGVDVANINPKNIRLFHNGGGVLPLVNKDTKYDDLVEIPIIINGENDGRFDESDMIIFYARGPVTWRYDASNGFYEHVKNPYSDFSCVFLTVGDTPGKRVASVQQATGQSETVGLFLDGQVYEVDEYNLNNMGATWYCDKFDVTLTRTYPFDFHNVATERKAKMRSEVATRNSSPASYKYAVGGSVVTTLSLNGLHDFTYIYAQTSSTNVKSFSPKSDKLDVTVTFSRNNSSSVGWLDYVEMNAWRKLSMSGDFMPFRNPECGEATKVYEYQLSNATSSTQVWDVKNPVEPKTIDATFSASRLTFKVNGDKNNEFVAFNGNSFSKTTFVGIVENQNLHALKDVDYLIIAHPKFVSHARRLKEIHSRLDDLRIEIVTPQTIYNEFSCGALDIAGIRNFIKMLYENGEDGSRLKYVLLFGDASYAYKNEDACFIPSYESKSSCAITDCIVTDDFFVCFGPGEGNMENGSIMDLPIGRMPVSTEEQATAVLDKIEEFIAGGEKNMNRWRNVVTLVCDDEDGGSFLRNAESVADSVVGWGGDMVVDKIYLDAYNQVATASGQRCPEANEAITNRIENGTLLFFYTGHGGEVGLAEERILTNEDINSWQNIPMLPVFLTATCEFSRFDDHTRTSAGEYVFLNPKGGAINMITTARTTSGPSSMKLVKRFFRSVFKMYDGEYQCVGDIFKDAKQDATPNTKVYALFGDPALRIAYPKNNVVITKLNGTDVNEAPVDTVKALSYIELEGEVRDNFGCVMNDFNGVVYVSAYDKENTIHTKGDNGSAPTSFKVRNSLIFNGKTIVENGMFKIGFIVPKDIRYDHGKGLVSLYATDYKTDANGLFSDFIVGGYDENVTPDTLGPEVLVYIDDTLFTDGGMTNENPVIIAKIRDLAGINTTGNSIGHDIMAVVSGATNKSYNLNNFYESPLKVNEFGELTYRLYNLNEGEHNLRLRVWDVFNNSTTVSINFNVVKSNTLAVENLINTPNPMSDVTRIRFDYNQSGEVGVLVRIYNISGQLVRTIEESRHGASMRIEPVVWDGTDDSGSPLPSGIYIYNVTVSGSGNEKASGFSKLIIAR